MPGLVLALDPADAPRLARLPGLHPARARGTTLAWHDTPDGALAARGTALQVRAGVWTLERLHPPSVLATAARRDGLGLPGTLAPVARQAGTARTLTGAGVTLDLLRLPAGCSLTLGGDPDAVAALASTLARDLSAHVPRRGLAATVLGTPHEPPAEPVVHPDRSVGENLAGIVAALLDSTLRWSDEIPAAIGPEPVHQMRVAIRRLRSALSVFKAAVPEPLLGRVQPGLKYLAARLGTARDWDVFLSGLGAELRTAFPDDRRCRTLLRAADRRRHQCYAEVRALLAGPEFRVLTVDLACMAALRPWPDGGAIEPFARRVLDGRLRTVRKRGRAFADLPLPALHELRKKAKRLRYTAEFMAPFFPPKPGRRFIRRIAALQDELGHLNDGATTTGLVGQLGRLERSYAAGLVEGFAAARAAPARKEAQQAWKQLRDAKPFWR